MTSTQQFRELYGLPARHSEHKVGETITYTDPGQPEGRNEGKIIYIAEATADEPLRYIITPTVGLFPQEITANKVISE